jgi:hypothetical protein
LDRRADRLRRNTDRRNLATALRAELMAIDLVCRARLNPYKKLLEENPDKDVFGGPHSFANMALPPRSVWMAHLVRIGELEDFVSEALTLVHTAFDTYDVIVETYRQLAGGQGMSRELLQNCTVQLERNRDLIAKAGETLLKQTKAAPPWWRRILRFKSHRTPPPGPGSRSIS